MNISDIKKIKDSYVEMYQETRNRQDVDQTYVDDTFNPAWLKPPHKKINLGLGYHIVHKPAEFIVTDNPQVFVEIFKGAAGIEGRLGEFFNKRIIPYLKRRNPDPFKETVKNKCRRGESYIKVLHNPDYEKGNYQLPAFFIVQDPYNIYGSRDEVIEGVPAEVIVIHKRTLADVVGRYHGWTNPLRRGDTKKGKVVDWFEYWNSDIRYFEADGEPVLQGGIQTNIYGIPPFSRQFSGFGFDSADGEIADLIMSDIYHSRGLIEEVCISKSDVASILHLFAHKPRTIITQGGESVENEFQSFAWGAYDTNYAHLPQTTSLLKFAEDNVNTPDAPMFQYINDAVSDLFTRHPFLMAGYSLGSSGRQQDLSMSAGMKRYKTVIENTEKEWAVALELAKKEMQAVGYQPDPLRKNDLDYTCQIEVKLKANDPLEQDRLATLGSRMLVNEIDPITNLVEFKGYTKERAEEITTDRMAWNVILNSPDIMELIGLRAAEKMGIADDIQQIKARRQQAEQRPAQMTSNEVQRLMGENTEGAEEPIYPKRGARRPPEAYTRS